MTELHYIVCIGVLLSILWYLFVFEYRQYSVDQLRSRLFDVRSGLFEAAKSFNLFDKDAYRLTRTTINGVIRFAHELSLVDTLVFLVISRSGGSRAAAEGYLKELNQSLTGLPIEAREAIASAHSNMHMAVLAHIVKTSVILGPLFFATYWLVRMRKRYNKKLNSALVDRETSREKWAILDAEANQVGRNTVAPA